eukprot:202438-Chlamydomonas_euryale.AAC.1
MGGPHGRSAQTHACMHTFLLLPVDAYAARHCVRLARACLPICQHGGVVALQFEHAGRQSQPVVRAHACRLHAMRMPHAQRAWPHATV